MSFLSKKSYFAIFSIILGMALIVYSLQFFVSAKSTSTPNYTMEEIDAYLNEHGEEYYAYMILDEAEETLKPVILEARWRIISRTGWVVDGVNGYLEDEEGNIEVVPQFHDIFPPDWDIQPGRGTY